MAVFYFSPIGNAQVFLASNGQPANGGFIYTYLAGTTTPAATFTSISGSFSNTNPIVLTPAGMAPQPIWLTGGQAYKFIITDALGNQIGVTEDNVRGIGDGSAGGGVINPMTTLGDMIIGGTAGAPQRLAIGTTGQILEVVGAVPTWATSSAATSPSILSNQVWGALYANLDSTGPLINVGLFPGGYPTQTGSAYNSSMTASTLGTIRRQELTRNTSGQVGWTANFSGALNQANLQVSSTAGLGGFYAELYAGIGENYSASANAGIFLGLASYSASATSPNPWSGVNQADFMGIGVPGGGGGVWSTIQQQGTGTTVTTTSLSPTLNPATQQLFALSFSLPAGSTTITMKMFLLTAPGTWSSLGTTTFPTTSGLGLTPCVSAVVNASFTVGVFWHRYYFQVDGPEVPRPF